MSVILARASNNCMLTVHDIVSMPGLALTVAGGREGLDRSVTWLHVSELDDPTPWLEGGELLLTTGLGVGARPAAQTAYLRRLAEHELAGLGFGLGFGFDEVPSAVVDEAERLGFPVLSVPYEVPFIAITKAAFAHLASERLDQLTQVLDVHERLAHAVLEGSGLNELLGIVCSHLDCSLALVDESGHIVTERHARGRLTFDDGLALPVVAGDERATLRAARDGQAFGEYERLVLHHGQTALAFELSRRGAVSAAELRLAGDLLEDLEEERLDERETARRIAAFGLSPDGRYAALLAAPLNGLSGEQLRREVAEELDRRSVRYLSTAQRDRAAFLVEVGDEEEVLALASSVLEAESQARVGVGRPANGRSLARSLLEARAALAAGRDGVTSYRELGSVELLLNLPDASLQAFVDRVLGPAAGREVLLSSLGSLLDAGCHWSEAAERLGVHRHTLRYRMERLRELTGRHPDEPAERMELWLALKARDALAARTAAAR